MLSMPKILFFFFHFFLLLSSFFFPFLSRPLFPLSVSSSTHPPPNLTLQSLILLIFFFSFYTSPYVLEPSIDFNATIRILIAKYNASSSNEKYKRSYLLSSPSKGILICLQIEDKDRSCKLYRWIFMFNKRVKLFIFVFLLNTYPFIRFKCTQMIFHFFYFSFSLFERK